MQEQHSVVYYGEAPTRRLKAVMRFSRLMWMISLRKSSLLAIASSSQGYCYYCLRWRSAARWLALFHQCGQLALLGVTQTSLQYVFFYIGLAFTTGVKGSIMNATGTFFSVLLAHFIYQNDKLSYNKTLGCVLGFAGVMVVNLNNGLMDFSFSLMGDGFVSPGGVYPLGIDAIR
jgi:drug/metabolite transporter (DMT)-like permease